MQFSEMVVRVEDVIRDFENFRYTETQIKYLINDGYEEFINKTHCLVKHSNITITEDTALYSVPSDNLTINRVDWKGRTIPVRTTREMDSIYPSLYIDTSSGVKWKTITGTEVLAVIQDMEGYGQFRIYPILDDADDIGGLVIGTDASVYKCIKEHTSASANKPVTGADYATYWEVTTTDGSGVAWESGKNYFIYYNLIFDHSYMPTLLSADSDEPAFPDRFHKALVDYAIGECRTIALGVDKDMDESNIWNYRFNKYIERCRGEVGRGFNSYRPRTVKTRPFI